MANYLEVLVGLDVSDDEAYDAYREAMKPILESFGGGFGYDFRIAEVLKSESDVDINRVFTIRFPDASSMDAFFSYETYLEVKRLYFEPSVRGTQIISQYVVEADEGRPSRLGVT